MSNDAAITVRNLHKHYGDKHAVDGLDLEIKRGEIFAILGPNGAGKSTTVEILEGYRERTSGDVTVLGEDPANGSREWKSRIGIVLQNSEDKSPLSAREYLTHVATFYPNPRDVEETILATGLSEKADARAKTMSGGQRRRLDVALGIIGNPELLFLDEPTTGFDPEARRVFWDMILKLKASGTTVVLTTHYLDEAEHLADRLAVVSAGKIVALDTPAALRARATSPIVSWTDKDGAHEEVTDKPTALIAAIAKKFKGEIPNLQIRRPSLEDVYLELIGAGAAATAEEVAA